ncbi:TetR/AcrR family transcriptional regulator [Neobacillus vireti]|uniref:TetR family transcriptional regulator n=1 Tax=Neobacillus vireti LMG 21834 TaxID=1131730 RepID=A0AB94IMJ7_9BACI|nr:TetR/AcrR family transcriptional regulator [Neobacillus vireti]ETI68316.1 TetR family transcriptional regulator [Neobacillus vireti LMG 21834]KLT16368.1 TetR family transcriptional regulator [Neobacillus vireti]
MRENNNLEDGRHLRSIITRNKIIKAAHVVFLREGFRNTTVKQIMAQANIGYGTFYGHFKGKDDLLIVLMENVMSKFFAIANSPFFPLSKENAKEIILSQVLNFLKIADTERDIMKVFSEAIGLSPIVHQKWEEIRLKFIQSITKDITYSQFKGLARTDLKAEIVARSWFFSNEIYQWEIVFNKSNFSLEEIASSLTTMYVDAIYF